MTQDHLAKEAARLRDDETLQKAFDAIRSEALDALAMADADDKTMILRLQQRAAVVDDIRAQLSRYILAADVQENAGSFA